MVIRALKLCDKNSKNLIFVNFFYYNGHLPMVHIGVILLFWWKVQPNIHNATFCMQQNYKSCIVYAGLQGTCFYLRSSHTMALCKQNLTFIKPYFNKNFENRLATPQSINGSSCNSPFNLEESSLLQPLLQLLYSDRSKRRPKLLTTFSLSDMLREVQPRG